jgi:hypothetical protein
MDDAVNSDIDDRSRMFVGLTRENLAAVTASFVRTSATPDGVASLLGEARRLLVGASHAYDNFAVAPLKALQAADLALKLRVGLPSTDKRTLGKVLEYERQSCPVLSSVRREWYTKFALRFRNKLSHPDESIAFSPGMSVPIVESVHEAVAELYPDP